MERLIVMSSLVVFLLVFAMGPQQARAATLTTPPIFGHGLSLSSPSPEQIKDLIRKTLGQSAVDHMLYPVTQPLATQRHKRYDVTLSLASQQVASAHMSSGSERYKSADNASGYFNDLGSPAVGVAGVFNVAPVTLPSSQLSSEVLTAWYNSQAFYFAQVAGVDQSALVAYYQVGGGSSAVDVLRVNSGDQVSSEIYQWSQNVWFIFIMDQTTGQYFSQLVNYTPPHTLNAVGWGILASQHNPTLSNFAPVTFTQANWISSSSSGWQPLISAPTYFQYTLVSTAGGTIWPTEVPNPPGNSFSLLPCKSCSA